MVVRLTSTVSLWVVAAAAAVVSCIQLAAAQRDVILASTSLVNATGTSETNDDDIEHFLPSLDGKDQEPTSDLELSILLIFFVVILALVVGCSVYSLCIDKASKSCFLFGHVEGGPSSFDAMMTTRSPTYFREDLLNEDEILRLWICFYCDFANYEMKTHCALCGNDKCEKEMPATPRSKARSIRPASLFASMATTISSSRSLSPSFLLASGTPPRSRSASASSPVASVNGQGAAPVLSVDVQSTYTTEASRSFASSSSYETEQLPKATATPPRYPSGTPATMIKRRKEWQAELSVSTGNVVWVHHSQQEPPSTDATTTTTTTTTTTSDDDRLPDKLVLETAFVTHNTITPEYPHGKLEFVNAQEAQVYGSSRPEYYNADSSYLFLDPFAVDSLRTLSFPEKHRWFMQETTAILHVRWGNPTLNTNIPSSTTTSTTTAGDDSDGTEATTTTTTTTMDGNNALTLVVPRENLFHGSTQALIAVSQKQLRRPLRVKFANEPGIDAGGIVREWFSLVVAEFLDESNGLFQPVHTSPTHEGIGCGGEHEASGLAYTIHPTASICVADYLLYYRAFGRLLGKALLEGHLIPVPLADFLLKHILSVPISFADLQALDGSLARSMLLLWQTPLVDLGDNGDDDDDDPYGLDFSVYHTAIGVVDLKPNGRNIAVTEANKHEYIALYARWHLGESISEEIAALVSGVYDVMPVHLLAPFDYHELRLLLCGSPSVDVDDWEKSTLVIGRKSSKCARVVGWFWKFVRALPMDQKCRLLQFATGAARVPVQGFKALTSSDGRLCPFTIYCVSKDECAFLRAYTCFNRLDVPLYKTEKELEEALQLLLQMDITGFSIQ